MDASRASPEIPEDIVTNVLLNLPVKSLLRFKCVSRPWRSLISQSQFTKNHLNRATGSNNDKLARYGYLDFKSHPSRESVNFCSCEVLSNVGRVTKFEYPFGSYFLNAEILGSCNGLLLIGKSSETLYLWNPSTREYKKFSIPYSDGARHFLWGLGFDSSSDDYKVVRVVRCKSQAPIAKFYSVKSNSWSDYRDFPYRTFHNQVGIILNKSLHWIVNHAKPINQNSAMKVIVCFDPTMEQFDEIQLPYWAVKYSKIELGLLGGSLCISHIHDNCCVSLWTMKQCTVNECWTKLFTIPFPLGYVKPLAYRENGEVVMEVNRNRLVTYKPVDGKFTRVLQCDNNGGFKVVPLGDNDGLVQQQAQGKRKGEEKRLVSC
ncbi:unnamed protein product [Ilex paraguariensis]|uniref:F-box domain-containing protein n=1 Tax=Ilex paraguariensis TaxID=185542 RepID=A0ABC8SXP8_9AQUA